MNWKVLLLTFLFVSVFAATSVVSFCYAAMPDEALRLRNGSSVALDGDTSEPLMPIDCPGGG